MGQSKKYFFLRVLNIKRHFKKGSIPKLSLFIIPIGVALFIAGTFSENRYAQSTGIAISVGFEMLNRIMSMRRTNYDYLTEYHKHSKEIVKKIKKGFGEESGILGIVSIIMELSIFRQQKSRLLKTSDRQEVIFNTAILVIGHY